MKFFIRKYCAPSMKLAVSAISSSEADRGAENAEYSESVI